MDPEVTTTEASAHPPQPEPVTPEPAKPLELEEFVHKQYEQLAAEESKTEEKPAAPEAKAADTEVKTPEPKSEQPVTAPPFTEEELSDGAFLGRLDADGWRKLESYNPSLYKAAKAVARAQGTVFELKRRLETQAQSISQPERAEEPEVDPYEEALQQTESLDPEERKKGFRTLARLEAAALLRERDEATGFDPVTAEAEAVERAAWRAAVQKMPELAELPAVELDAAVEADAELMDDVAFAGTLRGEPRLRLLEKVMRRAGRAVISNRTAAKAAADAEAAKKLKAAKDEEAQKRLRSNEQNPSKIVAETPSGKQPKGEKTIEDTIHEKVAALRAV